MIPLDREELVTIEYSLYNLILIRKRTIGFVCTNEEYERYRILRQKIQQWIKILDQKKLGAKFCKNGHLMNEKNTQVTKQGNQCRRCNSDKQAIYRQKTKAADLEDQKRLKLLLAEYPLENQK